jgi:hypothetical protein
MQLCDTVDRDHQMLLTALAGGTVLLFREGLPFSGQNSSTFGPSKRSRQNGFVCPRNSCDRNIDK